MDKNMFVFSVNRRSDAADVQEILVSVEKRQIRQNYRMN